MDTSQLIVDVREPLEYEAGHVDNALNIPYSEIIAGSAQLSNIDKDIALIVYCRTGNRSSMAIEILKQIGFSNLTNGINADHVQKNYLASDSSL